MKLRPGNGAIVITSCTSTGTLMGEYAEGIGSITGYAANFGGGMWEVRPTALVPPVDLDRELVRPAPMVQVLPPRLT